MSSKVLISFDASIKDGMVGIGIYDLTLGCKTFKGIPVPKKVKSFNAIDAEKMALVSTLQYMFENNITDAHLFTDNINLYNEGINKALLKKYACVKVELFWLPREFNIEADRLSKVGRSSNIKTEIKEPISNLNKELSTGLRTKIKEYSLERRKNLLIRLANSIEQHKIVEALFNDTMHITHPTNKEDKNFLHICCSLVNIDEQPSFAKIKRLYKKKPNKSNKQIEEFIRSRNLF